MGVDDVCDDIRRCLASSIIFDFLGGDDQSDDVELVISDPGQEHRVLGSDVEPAAMFMPAM